MSLSSLSIMSLWRFHRWLVSIHLDFPHLHKSYRLYCFLTLQSTSWETVWSFYRITKKWQWRWIHQHWIYQFSCFEWQFSTILLSTLEKNGLVWRKHKHIIDLSRVLFYQPGLPHQYWAEIVHAAVNLILVNRLPSEAIQNISLLYKVLFNTPDYKFLKAYDCMCYPSLRPYTDNKFHLRSKTCVFIGYAIKYKGWMLWPSTGRVHF